jgi:hypothetical protein
LHIRFYLALQDTDSDLTLTVLNHYAKMAESKKNFLCSLHLFMFF